MPRNIKGQFVSYPTDQLYVVLTASFPERLLEGRPSIQMIENGVGQAWMRDEGIWRAPEKTDPEGTVYTRVRVMRNPNHR